MLCVKLYKISNFFYKKNFKCVSKLVYWINKIINSCEIDPAATIGKVKIYHSVGVVIGGNVVIKDGVTIMSGVVIGASGYFVDGKRISSRTIRNDMPLIEEDAFLGANSCILGNVTVGKGAIIGANAVVLRDVPNKKVAIGIPANVKNENN